MFPEIVETDRLRLEPRTPEFVDTLAAYRVCSADEGIDEVTEHLPWEPHPHPKETREFLERGATQWEEFDSAEYVVRPRAGEDGAGTIAGFGGLAVDWDRRSADLGLWLRKPFWGRGYSGERAVALAELAFERLDLDLVTVGHAVENEKSRRAIEKYVDLMGGRREGVRRNNLVLDDPVDEVRYSVSAAEFAERDPDRSVTVYDDAEDAPPRAGGETP